MLAGAAGGAIFCRAATKAAAARRVAAVLAPWAELDATGAALSVAGTGAVSFAAAGFGVATLIDVNLDEPTAFTARDATVGAFDGALEERAGCAGVAVFSAVEVKSLLPFGAGAVGRAGVPALGSAFFEGAFVTAVTLVLASALALAAINGAASPDGALRPAVTLIEGGVAFADGVLIQAAFVDPDDFAGTDALEAAGALADGALAEADGTLADGTLADGTLAGEEILADADNFARALDDV